MSKELIAVIGAGGKTTAMGSMARQFSEGSVLVTTTTHIFPMTQQECRMCLTDPARGDVLQALSSPGIVCAGTASKGGKLGILPDPLLREAIEASDLTLYEADGANHHPLKLHRQDEPVILPGTTRCLIVAGLSALGKPVEEAVHRFQRNPQWEAYPRQMIGISEFLSCVLETAEASHCPKEHIRIYLNQLDTLKSRVPADIIAEQLQNHGFQVQCGSLLAEAPNLLNWVLS